MQERSASPEVLDYSSWVEVITRGGDLIHLSLAPSPLDIERACPWVEPLRDSTDDATPEEIARLQEAILHRRIMFELGRPRLIFDASQPYCTYCAGKMSLAFEVEQEEPMHSVAINECRRCGWWTAIDACANTGLEDFPLAALVRRATLARFAIDDLELPVDALRRHLVRAGDDIRFIQPRKLEDLVQQVFADFLAC